MPEISIIVPVYKVEKYLDRCVRSILAQTFKDFELLLVDDGSPDNCPKLCDEWEKKDERVKVIHKKNGGLSSARNEGLRVAIGNYIGFVDSDDWITEEMYSILYNLIIEYNADIACGEVTRTVGEQYKSTNTAEKISCYTREEFSKLFFKIGTQKTVHYVWNKLFRREVAKQIVFPEGLINEDVEGFFYALEKAKTIVTTTQIVYFYRENPNGISYKWFSKKQMDLLIVWKNVWNESKHISKQWEYYARMNYYRAFFGLLCRLMLNDTKEYQLYEKEKKYLLQNLKLFCNDLLIFEWPIKKKILMILMCVNYDITKWGVHFAYAVYSSVKKL